MPYYRRNIYILSCTIFLAALSWNLIVPFMPLFIGDMGVSGKSLGYWIGVVFAAQSAGGIIFQPLWGKLADSKGRKPVLIRAGVSLLIIYFLMSICKTPLQLAILRFLNGALTGFIPGTYALIATNTPEEIAPKYVATAQSACNAGLIAGPALGGGLTALVGYRATMQLAGAAILLATIAVIALVKEPNKVSPREKTSILQDIGLAMRSPVQSSVLFAALVAWSFGAIPTFLALHLKTLDGGNASSLMLGLVYAMPAVAVVLTARKWVDLGEGWGYERSIWIGMIGVGIGSLTLVFAHSLWVFGALYFVTGIWLASWSPSVSGITITRVEESFRGRAYGIQQSAGLLGGFIAPLAGAAITARYGIPAVFIYVSGIFLIGAALFRLLISRWPKPTA